MVAESRVPESSVAASAEEKNTWKNIAVEKTVLCKKGIIVRISIHR
jgi:hypothetical protein